MGKSTVIYMVMTIVMIIVIILVVSKNSELVPSETKNFKEVEKYLTEKYKEEFRDIELVRSVENKDVSHGLDGAVFWVTEGKGHTNYYKVYSSIEDMEFEVMLNTDKRALGDNIWDTYKNNLGIRKSTLTLYKKASEILDKNTEYMFTEDINKIKPYIADLEEIRCNLSRLQKANYEDSFIGSAAYVMLLAKIQGNILEFAKENYGELVDLNRYITETVGVSVDFVIIGDNDIRIAFNGVDGKVLVYDKFEPNKVWGEEIEEFIKRETY